MTDQEESGMTDETTQEETKDPRITRLREEISDTDRAIVELVNTRLRLVAQIKDTKASLGLDFVDPEREQWMLTYLHRANRGPLSHEGLDELFQEILDLTKREVARR
jgi:chorismate mutase